MESDRAYMDATYQPETCAPCEMYAEPCGSH